MLIGNDADNSIFGDAGNDRSYGLGGNDNILETTGKDLLDGGPGDDRFCDQGVAGQASRPLGRHADSAAPVYDFADISTDDVADPSCESVKAL